MAVRLALAALESGKSVVAMARRPCGFVEMKKSNGDRFTGIVHYVRDMEGAGDVLLNHVGAWLPL